jgi:hypothetical protein
MHIDLKEPKSVYAVALDERLHLGEGGMGMEDEGLTRYIYELVLRVDELSSRQLY